MAAGGIAMLVLSCGDGGRLVPPSATDLMAYCGDKWISDYSFTNALRFRLSAPPVLPEARGDYRLSGRSADGRELFAVSFEMPTIADADGIPDVGAWRR